jgi:hypothetical protein
MNKKSGVLEASHLAHTWYINQGAGGSKQMPLKVLFPNPTTAKRLHHLQDGDVIIPKAIGHDTFQQYTPRKDHIYPLWFINTIISIAEQKNIETPTTTPLKT